MAGETNSWYIDLKEKGEVVKGEPAKADGALAHVDSRIGNLPRDFDDSGQQTR